MKFTKEINQKARQIREEAAKRLGKEIKEIDWQTCVGQAMREENRNRNLEKLIKRNQLLSVVWAGSSKTRKIVEVGEPWFLEEKGSGTVYEQQFKIEEERTKAWGKRIIPKTLWAYETKGGTWLFESQEKLEVALERCPGLIN